MSSSAVSNLFIRPSHLMFTAALLLLSPAAYAADEVPTFDLSIQNHQFTPSTLTVPANKKIMLRVKNNDDTAEEFESDDLDREKVVTAHDTLNLYVGPLKPGEYPFFGDFHSDTARGKLIAK